MAGGEGLRSDGETGSVPKPNGKLMVEEQGLLDEFELQQPIAMTLIKDWLDNCKDYQNQSCDELHGHYRVMEDAMIEMLNGNKLEMKQQSDGLRQMMSQRRGVIREMWHKERLNIWMKLDDEASRKRWEEIAIMPKSDRENLKLGNEAGAMVERAQTNSVETSKNSRKRVARSPAINLSIDGKPSGSYQLPESVSLEIVPETRQLLVRRENAPKRDTKILDSSFVEDDADNCDIPKFSEQRLLGSGMFIIGQIKSFRNAANDDEENILDSLALAKLSGIWRTL
jgi:hypothetical protein